MWKKLCILIVIFLTSETHANCSSPEIVDSKTYTTQDATVVSQVAYIIEFGVKCSSGTADKLYAELDGNVFAVPMIVDNHKFQISWTEDSKTAQSGTHTVRLFDEAGYAALRKAIRAGEDTTQVETFSLVYVHHGGAFNGPWLKSEFLAAILSVAIAYLAFSSRSKLVS